MGLLAADIMVTRIFTFRTGQPIEEAMTVLVTRGISGAPVLDNRLRPVGILSETDCFRLLAEPERDISVVGDVMTTTLHSIAPDMRIEDIADAFLEHQVSRLPVVERGRVIGQVSRADVLTGILCMRHVAEHATAAAV